MRVPQIPSEILSEILSMLPAKNLVRFKCVSKTWLALIDNPYFTHMHLNYSMQAVSNPKVILKSNDGTYRVSMHVDSFKNGMKTDYFLDIPNGSLVLCTCNNLLILVNCMKKEQFTLYNPITKDLKMLPECLIRVPKHYHSHEVVCVGLGFDAINKGYKIVRVDEILTVTDKFVQLYEINVLSLKSNSWRRIESPLLGLELRQRKGVLVCNALHWIASDPCVDNFDRSTIIIAFDIEEEKFSYVPQPNYRNELWGLSLGALNGCLCLCTCDRNFFDTWTMKDDVAEKSWTNLFCVPRDTIINNVHLVRPLAYLKSHNEFLFSDNAKLYSYDVMKRTKKEVRDLSHPKTLCVGVFTESLVRFDG